MHWGGGASVGEGPRGSGSEMGNGGGNRRTTACSADQAGGELAARGTLLSLEATAVLEDGRMGGLLDAAVRAQAQAGEGTAQMGRPSCPAGDSSDVGAAPPPLGPPHLHRPPRRPPPSDDDGSGGNGDGQFVCAASNESDRLSEKLDNLANLFESVAAEVTAAQREFLQSPPLGPLTRLPPGRSSIDSTAFWNHPVRYARILRRMSRLVHRPELSGLERGIILPPNEEALFLEGRPPFEAVVRHPITLGEMVRSLTGGEEEGRDAGAGVGPGAGEAAGPEESSVMAFLGHGRLINVTGALQRWNMWDGKDLLQATDLALVNWSAYAREWERMMATGVAGGGNSCGAAGDRSKVRSLRRFLWEFITEQAGGVREVIPTKRGDSSGFVVVKRK